MTDIEIYKALPAEKRDDLGFARWRQLQQITTHGPGCHAWGPAHYRCALTDIEALQSRVQEIGQMARDNRSRNVVEMEGEVERLRSDHVAALDAARKGQG